MAGVKGKSGGPRKNSGGARPGAGRPPKEPKAPDVATPEKVPTARAFLESVMRGLIVPSAEQLDAAKLLARLEVAPAGAKKEVLAGKAKVAGAGKFRAAAPPLKLVSK